MFDKASNSHHTGNWLGGEAVAEEIDAKGFSTAGYVNITTSDNIAHGQVKQSGRFSFVRIYESGHEVPYYQPVVALSMFERAIASTDIATGAKKIRQSYRTAGSARSTYREGNATVQFEVLSEGATYNTSTNAPNPVVSATDKAKASASKAGRKGKRSLKPVRIL